MTLRPARSLATSAFLAGVFLHFIDVVAHAAVAFVDERDAVEADLGAAEVAIVGAGVFAVVELDVDHRGAFKADPDLDDAVLGGDLQAVHGRVRRDGGLAVGGRNVLVAGLRALEHAVFDDERRDDSVPDLGGFGAFEVVGEQELLLLGDRLGRDGRQVGREGMSGEDEEGDQEEGSVHWWLGSKGEGSDRKRRLRHGR